MKIPNRPLPSVALIEASKRAFSAGNLGEAERLCREAVQIEPQRVTGWVVFGMIAEARGDLKLRDANFERALAIDPECRDSLYLRATLALRDKRTTELEYCFKRLVEINPNDANAHDSLGLCYVGRGEASLAEFEFSKAVALTPANPTYHHNRGNALVLLNRSSEAEQAFRRAVKLAPKSVDSLLNLAQSLLLRGDFSAREYFLRAYEVEPNTARGLLAHANAVYLEGTDLESAVQSLESALKLDPELGSAYALMGMVLLQLGRIEKGNTHLERAIEIQPESVGPYGALFHAKRVSESDLRLVNKLGAIAKETERSKLDLQIVEFTLGKAHNDLGNYEEAMSHYHVANRLARENQGRSFDRPQHAAEIDRTIEAFTPDLFEKRRELGSESDAPIFIIGMYRSGSTLIEQTLSKHPAVGAGGELTFWPVRAREATELAIAGDPRAAAIAGEYLELLNAKGFGKTWVTDKQLENYRFAGLLHLLFPWAKFLYCHRNAIDNALSIYMTNFIHPLPSVSDPYDIVFAFRQHARLMDHWRKVLPAKCLLQVEYEELAGNFESTARQIVDFCGLEWDGACLQPESSGNAVRTASAWQVRQPVYQTSINRRDRYEPFLGTFRELADLE